MRVLIVDNFDSFTHNLAQVLGGLGAEVVVRRNRAAPLELLAVRPDRIVLSPGPRGPESAGSCAAVLGSAGSIPVLGVCLGMQVIARAHGARVGPAPAPAHGWATPVTHDGRGLFQGLPRVLQVGRYHSLAVDAATLPPELEATAWTGEVLMGLRHRHRPVEGFQGHPESVLTPDGPRLLANFLSGRFGSR